MLSTSQDLHEKLSDEIVNEAEAQAQFSAVDVCQDGGWHWREGENLLWRKKERCSLCDKGKTVMITS